MASDGPQTKGKAARKPRSKKDPLKNPDHPYTFDHLHNAYITAISKGDLVAPPPRLTMPVNLKRKSSASVDDDSVEPTKRGKVASVNTCEQPPEPQVDADGATYWEISKARRVTISQFKGKTMVGIREYYEKDSQWLPGKKGISMTIEQYSALIQIMPQIEELLIKSHGAEVPRPEYRWMDTAATDAKDEYTDEEMRKDKADFVARQKANFDYTSDEDEDE